MTDASPLSVLYADISGSTRLYEEHGDDDCNAPAFGSNPKGQPGGRPGSNVPPYPPPHQPFTRHPGGSRIEEDVRRVTEGVGGVLADDRQRGKHQRRDVGHAGVEGAVGKQPYNRDGSHPADTASQACRQDPKR